MRLLLTALLLAHSATAHDDGEKRVPWAGSETDLCWTPPHYYAPCVTDRHARRGVMLASHCLGLATVAAAFSITGSQQAFHLVFAQNTA
jgi:hypothetical protein